MRRDAAAYVSVRLTAVQRRAAVSLILELEPAVVDLSAQSVEVFVRQAFADLRSSVHTEALLDMAARLANQRIRAVLDAAKRSRAEVGARIPA